MRIRPGQAGDSEAIAGVYVASWRQGYAHLLPDGFLSSMDAGEFAGQWHAFLTSAPEPAGIFVADVDDDVVGFIAVGPYRPHDGVPVESVGEIYAIYVDPRTWARGAGSALLSAGIDHLVGAGFAEVWLWMFANNPRARQFYGRFGFRPEGASVLETFAAGTDAATQLEEQRFRLAFERAGTPS
jgi:ribosomal protein S18 acetylase RimI-like enzyme